MVAGGSLQALIFDVDGTLAETEDAHRKAFNCAFAEFGLPWVWDLGLYKRLLKVSGGKERMQAYAASLGDAPLDNGLLAELHRFKTAIYTEGVTTGEVPLRPGVARILTEARHAGMRLAIATTTSRANVLALLDGATGGEGHHWFELMACAEDVSRKKPDPEVYRFVLDRLGLAGVGCLAIEDSTNGVTAATAAGIPVVATRSLYTDEDDLSAALAVYAGFDRVSLDDLGAVHRGTAGK